MVASPRVYRGGGDRLGGTLEDLQRQVEELSRRSPTSASDPICRVKLNTNTGLAGNTETYAQAGGWGIGEDPDGLATLNPSVGPPYIDVPLSGRYLVISTGIFTAPSAASTMTVFVTKNAADSNYSIALDNRNSAAFGGATVVTASRPVLLTNADRLFWGHWSQASCTLTASVLGVPTEVSITYLGAR